MNKEVIKKNFAFTMAEVLITLSIIGVVAAITIPNFLQRTDNTEYITGWKKQYAELSNATELIMSEAGGTMKGVCPYVGWVDDSVCFAKAYAAKLNASKTCYSGATAGGCWHPNNYIKQPDGNFNDGFWVMAGGAYPGIILNNGAWLYFTAGRGDLGKFCLIIDVNGAKKPNIAGKDLFQLTVEDTKITVPTGDPNNATDMNNCLNVSGWNCPGIYLQK